MLGYGVSLLRAYGAEAVIHESLKRAGLLWTILSRNEETTKRGIQLVIFHEVYSIIRVEHNALMWKLQSSNKDPRNAYLEEATIW